MKLINKTMMMVGLVAAWLSGVAPGASAQTIEEEPIITLRTNIYEQQGAENLFRLMLGATETTYCDVDCGFGSVEVEVGVADLDQSSGELIGTVVPCTVNSDGIVKIYGDASKIDFIDAEGCYIDWIDMEKCENLTFLNLQHNELKRLDLTPFSKLMAVYLSDNPFTAETPLKIGGNKPNLAILEIDIIDHLDQSFNLSDYPAMVSFDGYHNMDLHNVDPTGCPKLQVLSLELAPVASLDVSRNPNLIRLNISDTRITTIDLSNNTELQHFLAEHTSGTINTDVKLEAVDLTHNPNLMIVALGGNKLESIDLSHNPAITNLNLSRNRLSTLDLSANTSLYSVNITYNNLNFATLPLPNPEWGEYYYFRDPLPCNRVYAKGETIDFSAEVCREGTTTIARVWEDPMDGEPVLLDEGGYTFADGKITFNTVPTDSVYVEFVNSAFEEYSLRSAEFKIKNAEEIGQPSQMVKMSTTAVMADKTISFKVGMAGATADTPQKFMVDFGEGTMQEFSATTMTLPETANVTAQLGSGGKTIRVYVPEGGVLTSLEIKDVTMSSIDLAAATELQELTINGCNLSKIDLANNRCLRKLDISGNRFTNVSLKGVYGDYEKHTLSEINASNNRLTNFEIVSTMQLRKLNLSNNYLATFNLKDYDNLRELDLSNNRLADEINLAYLGNAERIDLRDNKITSLVVVDMPSLQHFDVSDNALTLATLPYIKGVGDGVYSYAPQQVIKIAEFAPGVNLTAQNRVVDGVGTTYTWKKSDGTVLTEGDDYTCTNGATKFLKEDLGKVYCEMTHAAFPAFTGDNVLKTTETTVKGAPTVVVATFTTLEDTNNAEIVITGYKTSDLYIDWRGDGTEYIQYPMNAQLYADYPGQAAYAGANVTVYTYESPADVKQFSVYGVAMGKMDASPMTNLTAFSVGGAGLDENTLVFPSKEGLTELNLEGNNFSTEDFSSFPALNTQLILTNNKYESFDVSKMPKLQILMMSNNGLKSIKFGGNNALWGIDLSGNALEEFDIAGAPALEQIILSNNKLSHLDLSANSDKLKALLVEGNRFDFATLPLQSSFPNLGVYRFTNQAKLKVECVEGVVDLSSQAIVEGTPTTYRWFLGDVTLDADTGELAGEELETGGDNPEFTVEGGVTTFHYSYDQPVTCVMTNDKYSGLMLYTEPVTVTLAGIEGVSADAADAPVDVYSISGVKVRSQVARNEATVGLAPGFYVVGGQKVVVK